MDSPRNDSATRERSRWPVVFQLSFLAPTAAGLFALTTFATVFNRVHTYRGGTQTGTAAQARLAAKAAVQTRMLARSQPTPPRAELQNPGPSAQQSTRAAKRTGSRSGAVQRGAKSGAGLKSQRIFAAGASTPAPGTPVAVRSPDGTVMWHVGPDGFISVYAIEGQHYIIERQNSGVKEDLVAGSAASPKVCWVVGHSGTILRTADGGEHWQHVHSPTTADISAVAARTADAATIRTVAGARFFTADDGRTWKRR